MLNVEALRAELDQMRLRGAPLHHGYGAQHVSARVTGHSSWSGPTDLVA